MKTSRKRTGSEPYLDNKKIIKSIPTNISNSQLKEKGKKTREKLLKLSPRIEQSNVITESYKNQSKIEGKKKNPDNKLNKVKFVVKVYQKKLGMF